MALLVVNNNLTTFEEAIKEPNWIETINKGIESIKKNKTWSLVNLPNKAKVVGFKWIFKMKLNAEGVLEKHKARLVAKGYSQKHEIDYGEVYAPTARMKMVRTIVFLAAQRQWKIHQLDVKSVFLHGELEEDVYVKQP